MTTIFIPKINQHYYIKDNFIINLLTIKENIALLNFLKLLPGCATLEYWKNNQNIMTIPFLLEKNHRISFKEINIQKDSVTLTIYFAKKNKEYILKTNLSNILGIKIEEII
jgi:hypothetical protein